MGYSFLSVIEFGRSVNELFIGEMWLVLGINRLNYRKTLIAVWKKLHLSGWYVSEYEIVRISFVS